MANNDESPQTEGESTAVTPEVGTLPEEVTEYLDRVKSHALIPVCAGFGVRSAEQVSSLGAHADGVIVGSALVEKLEMRQDPTEFLASLRISEA